ncbi:ADP-ribose diphosphatase [Psychromonas sp. RZ22]|uniref:ADP-ribose diphosphatase n=1 Tax=Psychromonas algarum TaxID=2555643 RepID=UPI0010681A5E|nr:ADP-ribose diphosphatase [Psychromonas sp. RZ22]TEW55628.1 ADP-ribose diphosphatase [Psychromonas sp. RZ22]
MYDKNDVEVLACEPLYKGFFKCNKYTLKHRLFSGEWSVPIQREFFERGKAAALLAYDKTLDKVVLVEQFRFGAMAGEQSPWLLELIAGMIEEGEDAQDVVKREAFEEAGLVIGQCQFMLSYLVSPGGTTETIDLFIANVDSRNAEGIFGLAEEGEDIRAHVISREQAYQWVKTGKINNAATIIGLQWLELNREQGLRI